MGRIKDWVDNVIIPDQIDRYTDDAGADFINDEEIWRHIREQECPDPEYIRRIIAKSLRLETLLPEETAALINVRDSGLIAEMEAAAIKIKRTVYDNRIVTFAPLYMSSTCVNNCTYCSFREDNSRAVRRVLKPEEIEREVKTLAQDIGHKRLIVVYGEHPDSDAQYIAKTIKTIYGAKYKTRKGYGQIRRVNINAAPMSIEDLAMLNEVGIGTYQVFQETYHHDTYGQVHPAETLKGDYKWRLYSMHRAMDAGVDDVGIGALFGLYDWRFEVMGLLAHSRELEHRYGVGPHTISFPRLEPADNAPGLDATKGHHVDDEAFKHAVLCLRLSVPYTGMILTAREDSAL
ncbi:MAG: [FeFe] hydrogenase H-cluster radical SAM maturase HydG, partial [Fibrobacterota bacterium]